MKKKKVKQLPLVFFSLFLLAITISGCTSYYRVLDPTTDKVYYTTEVNELRGGAVKLKDAKTQRTVTVTNSEVEKISEKEYKQGLASDKPLGMQQDKSKDMPQTEEKQAESQDVQQSGEK